MVFSYYPGCTLKTKAKQLDEYGRKSAEALGISLEELPEWQCCGAVYPMAKDEIATKLSAVRALDSAKGLGNELITLCSACHHVLKRVNNDMATDDDIRMKVNNYLKLEEDYAGETPVSYTHLDVYKRQPYGKTVMSCQSSRRRTVEIKTVESEGKTVRMASLNT